MEELQTWTKKVRTVIWDARTAEQIDPLDDYYRLVEAILSSDSPDESVCFTEIDALTIIHRYTDETVEIIAVLEFKAAS